MARPWRNSENPIQQMDGLRVSLEAIDKKLVQRDKLREAQRKAEAKYEETRAALAQAPEIDAKAEVGADSVIPAHEDAVRMARANADRATQRVIDLEDAIFAEARADADALIAAQEADVRAEVEQVSSAIASLMGRLPILLEKDANLSAVRHLALGTTPRKRQSDSARYIEPALRRVADICDGIRDDVDSAGCIVRGALAGKLAEEAKLADQLEQGKLAAAKKEAALARGDHLVEHGPKVGAAIQKQSASLGAPDA
jgi:hypothetical protein